METVTNLLVELAVFFVVRTGRTQPDHVKDWTQVLWMTPKNDYFLRFNRNIAGLLAVMNVCGGKSSELHIMLLKNFDRTSPLQFSPQISLCAPKFRRIVCIVDAYESFGFKCHFSKGVGIFGGNKKSMIRVGRESAVGDNARGKTNHIAFVAVGVFLAPNSFVWGLRPVLWERRKDSKQRE